MMQIMSERYLTKVHESHSFLPSLHSLFLLLGYAQTFLPSRRIYGVTMDSKVVRLKEFDTMMTSNRKRVDTRRQGADDLIAENVSGCRSGALGEVQQNVPKLQLRQSSGRRQGVVSCGSFRHSSGT